MATDQSPGGHGEQDRRAQEEHFSPKIGHFDPVRTARQEQPKHNLEISLLKLTGP